MLPPIQTLPHQDGQIPVELLDQKGQRNNVHDFVYLNEIERRIVDTAPFQRLRYIKQLGFAHLVYETAEQSRFVHSTGTCHCAKILVDAINRNARFRQDGPSICWGERILVGLAALLHDIAHVPFSHALEQECRVVTKHDAIDKNPALWKYIYEGEIADVLDEYTDVVIPLLRDSQTSLRADLSGYSLKDLVFQILTFPDDLRLNDGTYITPTPGTQHEDYAPVIQPYLGELVGDTVCADLIDYLLRDVENTGVARNIDLKFLDRIQLALLPNGRYWHVVFDLCDSRGQLRSDARAELLFLLQTRYTMCEKVYLHRTKLAASVMLANAFLRCSAAGHISPEFLYNAAATPSDDALLRHLLRYDESFRLASSLLARRIHRPFFLINEREPGLQGIDMAKEKRALVKRFYPTADQPQAWNKILDIQKRLDEPLGGDGDGVLILCLPERAAYKDPTVLVRVPGQCQDGGAVHGNTRAGQFVINLKDDKGLVDHVRAMSGDHNMLWGLYLLVSRDYLKLSNVSKLEEMEKIWVRDVLNLQFPNAIDWRTPLVAAEESKQRAHVVQTGESAFERAAHLVATWTEGRLAVDEVVSAQRQAGVSEDRFVELVEQHHWRPSHNRPPTAVDELVKFLQDLGGGDGQFRLLD